MVPAAPISSLVYPKLKSLSVALSPRCWSCAWVMYRAIFAGYQILRIRPGLTGITEPRILSDEVLKVDQDGTASSAIAFDVFQELDLDCRRFFYDILLPPRLSACRQ